MIALLGLASVASMLACTVLVVRAAGRVLGRAGRYLTHAWRSWAFARERRAVKRREGVGALNAEIAHTLAQLVRDQAARIAALEARLGADQAPIVVADPLKGIASDGSHSFLRYGGARPRSS